MNPVIQSDSEWLRDLADLVKTGIYLAPDKADERAARLRVCAERLEKLDKIERLDRQVLARGRTPKR